MAVPDIIKISFEFSPKLGIRELPKLGRNHQSNVPGLYIVGDLADAPIIEVALRQGYDVAQGIAEKLRAPSQSDGVLDVIVVGAGPAGIGAALALQEHGLRYVLLEKHRPFQTIQNFPKHKFIFSEPREFENPGNFWFADATKEDLVDRWEEAIDEQSMCVQQPEEVVDVQREGGLFTVRTRVGRGGLERQVDGSNPNLVTTEDGENTYRCRRVILAIGRRADVRRLDIPGEDSKKVDYTLQDPADYAGKLLLVVGGGDSAVEAAVACAEAGAQVTLSYRKGTLSRPKIANREKIVAMAAEGKLTLALGTQPVEIRPDSVVLREGEETKEIPNESVLIFAGTKLPKPFLKRLGIRMSGEMDWLRAAWVISFALLTYCFYVLKSKKSFFPFGEEHPLAFVPDLLNVDLGFRTVDAGFWGTVMYSVLITGFGIRAYLKYPRKEQKRRYISLITFQLIFLFGIPELLAPLVIDRPWKMYALSVPWPLSIWSMVDAPAWANGDTGAAVRWLLVGAFSSFVLIPLYVRKNGERFCSYMCGCGGMAETLGDFWRHLAPRGRTAVQAEKFGKVIFLLAVPVTLMLLADAWGFIQSGAFGNVKTFASHWYGLMVDFWLASVIGVAMYPYLGNRFWCRFFCPLRAYMEMLAKWFSKIAIDANEKCIGCGECTRYCQMGIDVQRFAQQQESFHNGNSACIQCGICLQVCPMEVLSMGERGKPVELAV